MDDVVTLRDLEGLSPAQLDQQARSITARSARNDWLRLASIIGRIEDEGLWVHFQYGSTMAYATHELEIDAEQFMVFMNLWRMVKSGRPDVGIEAWEPIRITYALELLRLHAAVKTLSDGEQRQMLMVWVQRAVIAESAEDLKRLVDIELHRQPFVRFTVAVPPELLDLAEEALAKAAVQAGVDAAMAKTRRGRHLAFDVVLRTYMLAASISLIDAAVAIEYLVEAILLATPLIDQDGEQTRAAALDLIARHFLSTYPTSRRP